MAAHIVEVSRAVLARWGWGDGPVGKAFSGLMLCGKTMMVDCEESPRLYPPKEMAVDYLRARAAMLSLVPTWIPPQRGSELLRSSEFALGVTDFLTSVLQCPDVGGVMAVRRLLVTAEMGWRLPEGGGRGPRKMRFYLDALEVAHHLFVLGQELGYDL